MQVKNWLRSQFGLKAGTGFGLRLNVILTLSLLLTGLYADACVQYKLCCRKWLGSLECKQVCSVEVCPYGYGIEIK
jgi:hypothetical protein